MNDSLVNELVRSADSARLAGSASRFLAG